MFFRLQILRNSVKIGEETNGRPGRKGRSTMEQIYTVPLKKVAEKLKLEVVYAPENFDRVEIRTANVHRTGLQLTGFFDYFDPERIQIMGQSEIAYMKQFSLREQKVKYQQLMEKNIPALLLCHSGEATPECLEAAKASGVPVLRTDIEASQAVALLTSTLTSELAPRITRHGVFVEVYGEGLLLLGESGVGKSEAAVELIKRGHRLIADDAVEIKRVGTGQLIGSAPELIRYYIELRGIGVIDVRRIFGAGAVKISDKIDLVINLETWKDGMSYDRLGTNEQFTTILGVEMPIIKIPIKPGRNLAVILEVAAMNNRQKKMGYNSAREFTERINQHFESQMKGNLG